MTIRSAWAFTAESGSTPSAAGALTGGGQASGPAHRLISNARIRIGDDGLIDEVGSGGAHEPDEIDLGDSLVLPGLVNAHTHLELTALHGQVPFAGSFIDWIRGIVAVNRQRSTESHTASILDGFRRSLSNGVTCVGDIGAGPACESAWAAAPLHGVGFAEVLGMGPSERRPPDRSLDAALARREGPLQPGVSPHAPYSTAPELYTGAVRTAVRRGWPICTHLAETRPEAEFLQHGTGEFRDLLASLGAWDGSFTPPGCSPVAYLERLGVLTARPLLVHVNYAEDADLDLIAARGCAVAFCPRSHTFFGHQGHRWRDMLARGICVCLGTDSLASNDSLSVLDEARFLHAAQGAEPALLLTMATANGATALGLARQTGRLQPGLLADLTVLPLQHPAGRHPLEDVLSGPAQAPSCVLVGGRRVWPTPEN